MSRPGAFQGLQRALIVMSLEERDAEIQINIGECRIEFSDGGKFLDGVGEPLVAEGKQSALVVLLSALARNG